MLHHVGLFWIIETHKQLQYDMYKHNSDWMRGGTWYNTSICKKLHGKCLRDLLGEQELTYIISCVLLMQMKNNIHNLVMMTEAVEFFHYHQIQQHKYWF